MRDKHEEENGYEYFIGNLFAVNRVALFWTNRNAEDRTDKESSRQSSTNNCGKSRGEISQRSLRKCNPRCQAGNDYSYWNELKSYYIRRFGIE